MTTLDEQYKWSKELLLQAADKAEKSIRSLKHQLKTDSSTYQERLLVYDTAEILQMRITQYEILDLVVRDGHVRSGDPTTLE